MVTFKEFFSFKKNRFFWFNLVAMIVVIVAAALGTLQWLDNYTRHGEAVIVPNVKGMDLRTAENELRKQSLRTAVTDSSYVKGTAPGSILEQNPTNGAKVKSGRTVYLTINSGQAPRIAIPDLMDNSSFRQAEAKLRSMGFKLTDPEYISGEKDWVYSIKYRGRNLVAGEKIPHESVLTLTVGNGNDALPEDSVLTDGTQDSDDKPVVDKSWF